MPEAGEVGRSVLVGVLDESPLGQSFDLGRDVVGSASRGLTITRA
jgi:hypothetical protein